MTLLMSLGCLWIRQCIFYRCSYTASLFWITPHLFRRRRYLAFRFFRCFRKYRSIFYIYNFADVITMILFIPVLRNIVLFFFVSLLLCRTVHNLDNGKNKKFIIPDLCKTLQIIIIKKLVMPFSFWQGSFVIKPTFFKRFCLTNIDTTIVRVCDLVDAATICVVFIYKLHEPIS